MNFLSHIYLSGSDKNVMLGNFIGDYVKGRKHEDFAPQIQKGILLHRKIDFFMDNHPEVKKGKVRLYPKYHKYSGIVVDIFYDHFLAVNWTSYHSQTLESYSGYFYKTLITNYMTLPFQVQKFIPFLIKNKRLTSYASLKGVSDALNITSNHSSLPNQTPFAIETLLNNYTQYKEEFTVFFDEIIEYVKTKESVFF